MQLTFSLYPLLISKAYLLLVKLANFLGAQMEPKLDTYLLMEEWLSWVEVAGLKFSIFRAI
jgi:hypothetical protein